MDFVFHNDEDDWPDDCYRKYERIEILGKGSFGMVWMSRRVKAPDDEFDDEFVAIKCIKIKHEKGKVYAEREIRILQELRHPNVIRLIKAYPIYRNSRVVVMQLARGPNLHQLVVKRGALGIPLSRLVSRQLIAAVSYIHGRAVIHRDIKPSNCILALTADTGYADYDWYADRAIWSSKENGIEAVMNNKWKLMLVDFGFARALEMDEIEAQSVKLRNSIRFETKDPEPEKQVVVDQPEEGEKQDQEEQQEQQPQQQQEEPPAAPANNGYVPRSMYPSTIPEVTERDDEESIEEDMKVLESMVAKAADEMRKSIEATNIDEKAIFGADGDKVRQRHSGISMPIFGPNVKGRRTSKSQNKVRSMSALGTKAYAAPEIRRQLRHKTEADFEKANAAMTECVADYGMVVDAYSVGWTLRVAMTGVPPNFTISEYMAERETVVLEHEENDDEEEEPKSESCCCFGVEEEPIVRIRDPTMLPASALLLLNHLTEKKPEDRMTVREAQHDPWIAGGVDSTDPIYKLPEGDVPSKHGDPVVPLDCAPDLSRLTVQYHMQ